MSDREVRFRALFESCFSPLQAFARRRVDPAEADDLVADVLMVAWRRLDDIPDGASLPWLYGVAHRTLANQRRATHRRLRLQQKIVGHQRSAARPTGPANPAGAADAFSDHDPGVVDALDRLRPDDREILRLAAWEELTTAEIAIVLDCTANAAALRLSRARSRFRDALAATTSARLAEPEQERADG